MTPDEPAPPDLSVIVVTWNSRDVVGGCLRSVREGAGRFSVETVVVDNDSADGTADLVRKEFPGATVLENEANVGFPRACNRGLARSRGRHVLFLNPDCEVRRRTLPVCVGVLENDPDVGIVGPRLEYPDGRLQPECARRDYRLRHMLFETFWLHELFPRNRIFGDQRMTWWDHRGRRDVEAVSGAFLMVRREAAEAVGGMPEELFMYHEDQSFCLRVRRAGWRVRFVGDARAVHRAGASTAKRERPLPVLRGEYRVLLIREKQGAVAAALARILWLFRSLLRLAVAAAGRLAPGSERLRRRHPRVFDLEDHAWNLAWTAAPGWTKRRREGSR